MNTKITTSDIYDVDKKTGALVLGKNRLDDYATKFLNQHCKEALVKPMPLPLYEIIEKLDLEIKEVILSENMDIFGCCLLLDGEVPIFNEEKQQYVPTFFQKGTILIDKNCVKFHTEGFNRNTLIHEIIHWEKDQTYFKILNIRNSDEDNISPIMCRQSESHFEPTAGKKTKENEVKWLEWQAHKLAPRILMPKEAFTSKALATLSENKEINTASEFPCKLLIDELSVFFKVSKESVKYRIIEVDLIDKLIEFSDFSDIFEENVSTVNHCKLSVTDAYSLMEENTQLRLWVSKKRFIFVDGYFVLNNESNYRFKNGVLVLSAKAKRNLTKCVLNIQLLNQISYGMVTHDLVKSPYFSKEHGVGKSLLVFHPQFQPLIDYEPEEIYEKAYENIFSEDYEKEIELAKMFGDPTTSLCQCLWFIMEYKKWTYPETFNEKTHLHKNYHGKIKNNNYNNMNKDTLMAICVGLSLIYSTISSLFDKSANKLNRYEEPDRTYIWILERIPTISLVDFNSILEKKGIPELGTKSKI